MTLLLTIGAVWMAVAAVTLVGLAALGRAGRVADHRSAESARQLIEEQYAGVRLAVSNDRVITREDQAVCPACASLVVGALDGDPCPACGTAVSELPRIRPHVEPAVRRTRTRRAI